jgi:hypothetical protein
MFLARFYPKNMESASGSRKSDLDGLAKEAGGLGLLRSATWRIIAKRCQGGEPMALFRKVRVLVGALVHRPFLPRVEKAELDESQSQGAEERHRPRSPANVREVDLPDQERVADLIVQQQRDGG